MNKGLESLKDLELQIERIKQAAIIINSKVYEDLEDIEQALKRLESKDERHKYIEHIYYNWEEMKENYEAKIVSLQDELEQAKKDRKENELLKEIIKSLFDRGCPLHQYTDKKGTLQIEVDDECSIMRLGEFKGVDLDKKLKEVLE